jgi:hypothetical protein
MVGRVVAYTRIVKGQGSDPSRDPGAAGGAGTSGLRAELPPDYPGHATLAAHRLQLGVGRLRELAEGPEGWQRPARR